ncbi:MAG: hypothetical protein A2934_04670 [Candidatus Sungbacteria bacterium RIFCSPLOWO2_01_FULL_47_10]|uniref:Uncharacterized protein n=1 Tax=Candidatus Sungbacteria bacterium RIFCSPLOWO2_01_FULL_47_10 TaxID=1802276 RepID=A0A1G2KY45_9BACT|nr:MAG: hypothetical protein A2934_04670 [Candidatus Sungbacteria bacterium RIFCSPLOWO2_01_FULL_47_10]
MDIHENNFEDGIDVQEIMNETRMNSLELVKELGAATEGNFRGISEKKLEALNKAVRAVRELLRMPK